MNAPSSRTTLGRGAQRRGTSNSARVTLGSAVDIQHASAQPMTGHAMMKPQETPRNNSVLSYGVVDELGNHNIDRWCVNRNPIRIGLCDPRSASVVSIVQSWVDDPAIDTGRKHHGNEGQSIR